MKELKFYPGGNRKISQVFKAGKQNGQMNSWEHTLTVGIKVSFM